MELSAIASIIGLVLTVQHTSAHAAKYQELEGKKSCDFSTVYVLQKAPHKIYLKMKDKVYVMTRRATNVGVEDIERFETKDGSLVFLQTPQKALVLDNVKMTPLLNECINS